MFFADQTPVSAQQEDTGVCQQTTSYDDIVHVWTGHFDVSEINNEIVVHAHVRYSMVHMDGTKDSSYTTYVYNVYI